MACGQRYVLWRVERDAAEALDLRALGVPRGAVLTPTLARLLDDLHRYVTPLPFAS